MRLRDLHPLWSGLQTCSPMRPHLAPAVRQNRHGKSHNPDHATPAGYHTWTGLAPSAFARHYSRNHCCFLFLRVLRCFTSPRSLQAAYVFSCRSCGMMPLRGFPIRKSWPQRPVIDSTRLIADSHVLHRLPMPRHPPCALENLTTNRSKKLIYRENHENQRHTPEMALRIFKIQVQYC